MRKFAIWTAGTKKTNKQTRSATVRQAGTASNNGVENTINTKYIAGKPPKKRQNYTSAEAYENRDVCEGMLASCPNIAARIYIECSQQLNLGLLAKNHN
jgi:hypothetical protein